MDNGWASSAAAGIADIEDRTLVLFQVVVLGLICLVPARPAAAQTAAVGTVDLEAELTPGRVVWLTDATGREEKMRIVGVSGDVVTATVDNTMRRVPTTDVRRVRARQPDSILNGALIGAGGGIAVGLSGLYVCHLTEPAEDCRDQAPPVLARFGAIGAGIGIGIDALIQGRKTIYQAAPLATRVSAAPILTPRERGVRVSVSF